MELWLFFGAFVLVATAVHVAGQPGFLSIDCGLDDKFSGRRDTYTDIVYVSDSPYVNAGEKMIAADPNNNTDTSLLTLRSFPSGVRNCYTLPTKSGAKYLVRMVFLYRNYDGKNRRPSFEVHLGTSYWDTFQHKGYWVSEAIFIAWASWVPVCLVNTNSGTPFVNTVELRQLETSLYPQVTADESMANSARINLGAYANTRFPDDPYDRIWELDTSSSWTYLSTKETIRQHHTVTVPIPVLQTAVTPVNNGTMLNINKRGAYTRSFEYMFFLHFADIQKSQLREFDVYINDNRVYPIFSPPYLVADIVGSSEWFKTTEGKYNITLVASATSMLPPMLSAYEVYYQIIHDTPRTSSKDFDAMMAIKVEYGVKKNWMGDPCFPPKHVWNGVKCSNISANTLRIISLDLSNSNLNGVISENFTLLTELQFL